MSKPQSSPDKSDGFDGARRALWGWEARVHAYEVLAKAVFAEDPRIEFIYVDDWSRADRMDLTAFDASGAKIGGDTVYNDDGRGLPVTYEFSINASGREIPKASDLAHASENGWVIDMAALRAYDPVADRRQTQRSVVLANLSDLIASGDVRHFLFTSGS